MECYASMGERLQLSRQSSKTGFTSLFPNEGWKQRNLMGLPLFPALSLLFLLIFGQCAPSKSSFFGEAEWQAVDISGNPVQFSDFEYELVALNVYSPDCVPCWKEIPALNYIHSEILAQFPSRKLFMVVDPYQIVPDLPRTASWGEAFGKAKERMLSEVKERKILLPVLFMKPPFEIKQGGLVTGTPETLLFETKPLRLYYNFIGSISEESKLDAIQMDPKVKFFRHQFGLVNP